MRRSADTCTHVYTQPRSHRHLCHAMLVFSELKSTQQCTWVRHRGGVLHVRVSKWSPREEKGWVRAFQARAQPQRINQPRSTQQSAISVEGAPLARSALSYQAAWSAEPIPLSPASYLKSWFSRAQHDGSLAKSLLCTPHPGSNMGAGSCPWRLHFPIQLSDFGLGKQ